MQSSQPTQILSSMAPSSHVSKSQLMQQPWTEADPSSQALQLTEVDSSSKRSSCHCIHPARGPSSQQISNPPCSCKLQQIQNPDMQLYKLPANINYVHTCMPACIHTYINAITSHCIALHCIALFCIALHCITLQYNTIHYMAVHYITYVQVTREAMLHGV